MPSRNHHHDHNNKSRCKEEKKASDKVGILTTIEKVREE
jgi:hypothetical protein